MNPDQQEDAEQKKRTTITIDPDLHEQALQRAKKVHHTDFSGLITKLLVDDIHHGPKLEPMPGSPMSNPAGEKADAAASQESAKAHLRSKTRRKGQG